MQDPQLLDELARQEFATPCYVFDPAVVAANYRSLKAALGTRLVVSIKANPELSLLLRCAHEFVDGIEFASVAELDLSMGRVNAPKFANNPSMDAQFLRGAIAAKATIIVDGLDHAERIVKAKGGRPLPPVVLRLNTAALIGASGGRGLHADHFGMDVQTACAAVDLLGRARCEVAGIHMFGGSGHFAARHLQVLDALPAALAVIEARVGAPLAFLNLGGGFDRNWAAQDIDFAGYRRRLEAFRRYDLAHESGRAVFQSAGWFLTRVNSVKHIGGKAYAVCDGGISQAFLLCQTERFTKQLQAPAMVRAQAGTEPRRFDGPIAFVGSSCSSADVIGALPAGSTLPEVGDLCCFDNCGAYSHTYTPSRFLSAKTAGIYIRS
ncbi:PLP-dependent decarboxylase [Ramlibacter sp.]|uniref:PLP-dependent decarboxylase n=1 Tax=Ramlibacter sp. TaxID=1917967 RepID=UPI001821C1B2|nr:PLP-dependent decarboxylase [Ramlibacter sp.]MBA2674454.1 PLP-dependent decarboxylase [Ramlibacter sp.]